MPKGVVTYRDGKPPRSKPGQPRRVEHLRRLGVRHGAYSVFVVSVEAWLSTLNRELSTVEAGGAEKVPPIPKV
jgi:hypothetical protein